MAGALPPLQVARTNPGTESAPVSAGSRRDAGANYPSEPKRRFFERVQGLGTRLAAPPLSADVTDMDVRICTNEPNPPAASAFCTNEPERRAPAAACARRPSHAENRPPFLAGRRPPMKLLRYGPKGRRSPGCSMRRAASASSRATSTDIAGDALSPAGLAPAARARRRELPRGRRQAAPRRPASAGVGKFICIGLNYADHAAETGTGGAAGADHLHEGDQRHLRPQRRRRDPARLRARPTGRSSSASSSASTAKYVERSRRAGPCRRLLRRQRRLRARLPGRAQRPVDQGQEPRHLRPDRPVAGDHATRWPIRRTSTCGSRSTASACRTARPRRWSTACLPGQLSQPVHEPAAGRHHLHRHAAGRRHGHEAAGVPEAGQTMRLGIEGLGEQQQRTVQA